MALAHHRLPGGLADLHVALSAKEVSPREARRGPEQSAVMRSSRTSRDADEMVDGTNEDEDESIVDDDAATSPPAATAPPAAGLDDGRAIAANGNESARDRDLRAHDERAGAQEAQAWVFPGDAGEQEEASRQREPREDASGRDDRARDARGRFVATGRTNRGGGGRDDARQIEVLQAKLEEQRAQTSMLARMLEQERRAAPPERIVPSRVAQWERRGRHAVQPANYRLYTPKSAGARRREDDARDSDEFQEERPFDPPGRPRARRTPAPEYAQYTPVETQFGHGMYDDHDTHESEAGSEDSIDAAIATSMPLTKGVEVKALDKLPDMGKLKVGRERLRAGAEWFRKVGLDVAIIHPRGDASRVVWRWVKREAFKAYQDYLEVDTTMRGFYRVDVAIPNTIVPLESRLRGLLESAVGGTTEDGFRYAKRSTPLSAATGDCEYSSVELVFFVFRAMWNGSDDERKSIIADVRSPAIPKNAMETQGKLFAWKANIDLIDEVDIAMPDIAHMRTTLDRIISLAVKHCELFKYQRMQNYVENRVATTMRREVLDRHLTFLIGCAAMITRDTCTQVTPAPPPVTPVAPSPAPPPVAERSCWYFLQPDRGCAKAGACDRKHDTSKLQTGCCFKCGKKGCGSDKHIEQPKGGGKGAKGDQKGTKGGGKGVKGLADDPKDAKVRTPRQLEKYAATLAKRAEKFRERALLAGAANPIKAVRRDLDEPRMAFEIEPRDDDVDQIFAVREVEVESDIDEDEWGVAAPQRIEPASHLHVRAGLGEPVQAEGRHWGEYAGVRGPIGVGVADVFLRAPVGAPRVALSTQEAEVMEMITAVRAESEVGELSDGDADEDGASSESSGPPALMSDSDSEVGDVASSESSGPPELASDSDSEVGDGHPHLEHATRDDDDDDERFIAYLRQAAVEGRQQAQAVAPPASTGTKDDRKYDVRNTGPEFSSDEAGDGPAALRLIACTVACMAAVQGVGAVEVAEQDEPPGESVAKVEVLLDGGAAKFTRPRVHADDGIAKPTRIAGVERVFVGAERTEGPGELLCGNQPIASHGTIMMKTDMVTMWRRDECMVGRLPGQVEEEIFDKAREHMYDRLRTTCRGAGATPYIDEESYFRARTAVGLPQVEGVVEGAFRVEKAAPRALRPSIRLMAHHDAAFDRVYAKREDAARVAALMAGMTNGALHTLWSVCGTARMFEEVLAREVVEDEVVIVDAKPVKVPTPKRRARTRGLRGIDHCILHWPSDPLCSVCRRILQTQAAARGEGTSLARGRFVGVQVLIWDLRGPYPTAFRGSRYLFVCVKFLEAEWDADHSAWRYQSHALFLKGIPRKDLPSVRNAVHQARGELRVDGAYYMHCDHERAAAVGEGFGAYLAETNGQLMLGIPGRRNAQQETFVRKGAELVQKNIRASGLDPRHWDTVAETSGLWYTWAEIGMPPLFSEVAMKPMGLYGTGCLPLSTMKKRMIAPRSMPVAFVGVDRRTTKGVHIVYPGDDDKLHRTIANDASCVWSTTGEMAFEIVREGLREFTHARAEIGTAQYDQERDHKFWVGCDLCSKFRRTTEEAEADARDAPTATCSTIPKFESYQGGAAEYYTCDEEEEALSDDDERVARVEVHEQRQAHVHSIDEVFQAPECMAVIDIKNIAAFQEELMQLGLGMPSRDEIDELPFIGVTRAVTKAERKLYERIDWQASIDKEARVFRDHGVFGECDEFDDVRRTAGSDAKIGRVHDATAIKNFECDDEEARCRIVMDGGRLTDVFGKAYLHREMYDQPASILDIRMFITIALLHGWLINVGDVSGAYLHAEPVTETYAVVPEALKLAVDPIQWERATKMRRPVFRVKKMIYGDVEAGFVWSDFFAKILTELGGSRATDVVYSLWLYWARSEDGGHKLIGIVLVYVDDWFITGTAKWMRTAIAFIQTKVKVKFVDLLGPDGMRVVGCTYEVHRDAQSRGHHVIIHDMRTFAKQMCQKYRRDPDAHICGRRVVQSPAADVPEFDERPGKLDAAKHVCTALFGVRCAYPAETQAVNMYARQISKWSLSDDAAYERVVRWFEQHEDDVLQSFVDQNDLQDRTLVVVGFADGDHAAERRTRKSTSGGAVFLFGKWGTRALLDWLSKVQNVVALSTGESELTALAAVGRVVVYIVMVLEHVFGFEIEAKILVDSTTAIQAVSAGFSQRMRYARKSQGVVLGWLHDMFEGRLDKIDTRVNVSDIETKPLDGESFPRHRRYLGQVPYSHTRMRRCKCRDCACIVLTRSRCVAMTSSEDSTCDACRGGECACDCSYGRMNEKRTVPTKGAERKP